MKLTKEGRRFLLTTLLIIVAALNTGNNLIYLISSMMFSILLLSIIILRFNINGLTLKVSHFQPIFANTHASIDVTVSNKKRILPSYSIKVLMPVSKEKVYFPRISGLSDISKSVSVLYKKRGIYRYGDFLLESSFPFIFFSKKIPCRVSGEVMVYPEIREIREDLSEFTSEEKLASWRIGKGDEFIMIRELRYGDDWRRIHWKASAKRAEFMVKEYATEEPKRLTVILDNLMPQDSNSFEKAVSLAASITHKFLNEGFFVRFLTCRKVIPFGTGREHLFKILDLLATIEGQKTWESPMSVEHEGGVILILNSEGSPLNRFIPFSDRVIYATAL